MSSPFDGYEVDRERRPSDRDTSFDLDAALSSILVLQARVPRDAYTAGTLGAERVGNGIVISPNGLVLTIGYLITEAQDVELLTGDGRTVPAHPLGYDQQTGFGLVHALEPLGLPALPLGDSRKVKDNARIVLAGGGGRAHAISGQLIGRASFAGYWEYLLDTALFTAPAHPHWSGAALIGPSGSLIGVGSLQMAQAVRGGARPINMCVPIELLPPILDDLAAGRAAHPPRPWLGVFAQDVDSEVAVLDVSADSPASRAELHRGDVIVKVGGEDVEDLADFYRKLWAVGSPGAIVALTLKRDADVFDVEVRTGDRGLKLKRPRLN